ncbi:hypothetical protein BOTBODRAFT_525636 [Botryobasidium botryosum FD-172 SS1]|uniref:Uncharacterized protein n=1 Tax=Botryobasidium botryosum (strain FD-172 SS1) TaxID=930990 RepID=A0A067M4C1_BOTB1|nr:hypothetical protein BOTBODRAFT_525636 [Botryobasidium botryosum FD-172 SS1]
MRFLSLLATTAIAAFVSAAPLNCPSIPSQANMGVLKQVYQITQARRLDERELLATIETAWVESHVNNLPCGDQDSVGVFQQRPSQGWGTVAQCMDINHATNAFIDTLIPNAKKFPTYSAGQLAQSVQRSEYPYRYDQAAGIAQGLIKQVRGH